MSESAPALPGPGLRKWPRIVASVGGVGFCPWAPGTVASLVAVAAGAGLMRLGSAALPEAVLAVTILGLLAVERSGGAESDPGWIVIDEVAGQWLTMVALAHVSAAGLGLAFVLFRLLDIFKPGPIGVADRQKNAGGVMGDDLIAGGIAAVAIWLLRWQFPHLLG